LSFLRTSSGNNSSPAMRIVVGASMALAMNRLPSTAPPSARRTAAARPLRTTISLTSAEVMTEPPHTSSTRASASGKLAEPPTGSVNSMTLAKMSGKTIPARDAFGRYDVHVRGEQRADAVVFEMLAHRAEQVVLGVRKELLGLRAGEAILELVDRKRRVE